MSVSGQMPMQEHGYGHERERGLDHGSMLMPTAIQGHGYGHEHGSMPIPMPMMQGHGSLPLPMQGHVNEHRHGHGPMPVQGSSGQMTQMHNNGSTTFYM